MTIIRLPKNIDEIQEPEALPEDYYKVRIIEEPEVVKNKKKTGNNLILSLRTISENPSYNGRPFRKWISLPTAEDANSFTSMGQSKEDFKMGMLKKISEGFSGLSADGNEISLQAGMEAWVYITQGLDQSGTRLTNDLDFMSEIKPV